MKRHVTVLLVLGLVFMVPGVLTAHGSPAAQSQMSSHWGHEERIRLKENMVFHLEIAKKRQTLDEKEWPYTVKRVWSETALDHPILAKDWASLLSVTLLLPKEESERLLDMYVYGLTDNMYIQREDGVGGLVKLLTVRHTGGNVSGEVWERAKAAFRDFSQIEEKHQGLIAKAHDLRLLDPSPSADKLSEPSGEFKMDFRPKDLLTHAEAVFLLNRVFIELPVVEQLGWPENHWAYASVQELFQRDQLPLRKMLFKRFARIHPDTAIPAPEWESLISELLISELFKTDDPSPDAEKTVTREQAVLDLVRIFRPTNEEVLLQTDNPPFQDIDKIRHPAAVSYAWKQGWIFGYADGTFKPENPLSYGEAAALLSRMKPFFPF